MGAYDSKRLNTPGRLRLLRVSARCPGLAVVAGLALPGCVTDYHPGNPQPAGWQNLGSAECFEQDASGPVVTYSTGSDKPSAERCGVDGSAVAVCWDQTTFRNPAVDGAACGYQRTRSVGCINGIAPGNAYACIAPSP